MSERDNLAVAAGLRTQMIANVPLTDDVRSALDVSDTVIPKDTLGSNGIKTSLTDDGGISITDRNGHLTGYVDGNGNVYADQNIMRPSVSKLPPKIGSVRPQQLQLARELILSEATYPTTGRAGLIGGHGGSTPLSTEGRAGLMGGHGGSSPLPTDGNAGRIGGHGGSTGK